MRHLKSRFLTLTVCATAMVALVAANEAQASGRHIRKHQHRMNLVRDPMRNSWAAGDVRPIAAPRTGSACPGNARAIDCTVWPPPIDDDPDRKASSSDGGG